MMRTPLILAIWCCCHLPVWAAETPDALVAAASRGDLETIEACLAAGISVDATSAGGSTALIAAAYAGRYRAAELLLDNGASFSASDRWTPLTASAYSRHLDVALLLLARGADPNHAATRNDTPLRWAVIHGMPTLTQALLDAGAHVHEDDSGFSALHWLSKGDTVTIASLLIAAGAELNAVNTWGRTPLHRAVERLDVALVESLLQSGADPNLQICRAPGWVRPEPTPLQCLISSYMGESGGLCPPDPLPIPDEATRLQQLQIAALLLDAGADPERNFQSPLAAMAFEGRLDLLQLLLDAGADPNGGYLLRFPLESAVGEGHAAVCRALLEAGADPNRGSLEGWWTPLESAIDSERHDLVRLLLEYGARLPSREFRHRFPPSPAVAHLLDHAGKLRRPEPIIIVPAFQ